jgi:hypothetical protein
MPGGWPTLVHIRPSQSGACRRRTTTRTGRRSSRTSRGCNGVNAAGEHRDAAVYGLQSLDDLVAGPQHLRHQRLLALKHLSRCGPWSMPRRRIHHGHQRHGIVSEDRSENELPLGASPKKEVDVVAERLQAPLKSVRRQI